ncbi:MAG TPA: hypothetical protein VMH22_08480 [bacterium]|nr:hypothetical protein [bacterium]
MNVDLSKYIRDETPKYTPTPPREIPLYNRWGKAIFRLRGTEIYDFKGRPRGYVVGTSVYDLRGEHRGFWKDLIISDRTRRIVGFSPGASIPGLSLPLVEFPPLVYKDFPAPKPPPGLTEVDFQGFVAAWSVMQFENMLPSFDENESDDVRTDEEDEEEF